jgi:tRNA-Thr(GGU) m(6)t(6)A37 methyltransferase TsaA
MDDADRSPFPVAPIGVIRSPFADKFGVPRQAGLVDEAIGVVELYSPFDQPEMLDGLADFSHLWLVFRFDRVAAEGWRRRVRPPRLGGNREVGVWASRSPYRPNHLGLSAVRLIEILPGPPPGLRVAGIDLVDGTPIVDIKPYLPYADALPDARGAFADVPPEVAFAVVFNPKVESQLAQLDPDRSLRRLVSRVIGLDPRPAYRQHPDPERVYGMRLADLEVRWRVFEDRAEVVDLYRA